jgi:hypothetical protein
VTKGITVKGLDLLSTIVIMPDGISAKKQFVLEFELISGIMQKLGHQHLAYDSIADLHSNQSVEPDYRKVEYHFDYFIIVTKSTFDLVAHLINRILKLGFSGRNIDLSSAGFRNDTLKESHQLGTILNSHQSWINQITNLRVALEHHKVIPIFFTSNKHGPPPRVIAGGKLHFAQEGLSLSEMIELLQLKGKLPKTIEVLSFCNDSLRNTMEIVEDTFGLAAKKLKTIVT